MKKLITAVITCMMLNLSGVFAQDFHCFIMSPPAKFLENVKKVSVLDFDGRKGEILADYLTTRLLLDNRGISMVGGGSGLFASAPKEGKTFQIGARTNVFTIIERSQLNKVIHEQNFSNSGRVDDSQAAQVGKILGIDAIITGTVSYSSKDEARKDKVTNNEGVLIGYVDCIKRTVTVEARMKIISVSTGQIIGTETGTASSSDDKCGDQRTGLSTPEALADACLQSISGSLASYFNPYFTYVKYKFEKIKVAEFKDKAKVVRDYLENNDLNNAFSIYKAVYDADPYNASAANNVGNLYDIVGNYEKSLEYYKIAAEIDAKTYQPSVQWAEKEIAMNKTLVALGVIIEKNDFTFKADAMAKKVTTRGSTKDRYDVKTEPSDTSETLAKVPGGTQFTVIEEKGDWVLIKILGGKQGYINSANVK